MTDEAGFLIVFEGLDGAGLSTQSALLAEHLREKNEKVLLTKEPTSLHNFSNGFSLTDIINYPSSIKIGIVLLPILP